MKELSNLQPGVSNADIEEQAGQDPTDFDCQGNNCGNPADDFGPDDIPYCSECLKRFPKE